MKNDLTDRQQEIFNFVLSYRKETGYPPTLREIGKQFNISSTFGVKRHLDALVKKGFINIESNTSRGINVIDNSPQDEKEEEPTPLRKIPILGRVAAGTPVISPENFEGSISIDPAFLKPAEDCFALKVRGDSMVNAGIFEDDFVIVSRTRSFNNNEIVVAIVDEEATVKRFVKKGNKVYLIPENEKYKVIEVDSSKELRIAGKVVGVIRWFNN